jgi:hypothetical protein
MIGLEPQILGGSVKQSDDLKKPLPLNDLLKHLFKYQTATSLPGLLAKSPY